MSTGMFYLLFKFPVPGEVLFLYTNSIDEKLCLIYLLSFICNFILKHLQTHSLHFLQKRSTCKPSNKPYASKVLFAMDSSVENL